MKITDIPQGGVFKHEGDLYAMVSPIPDCDNDVGVHRMSDTSTAHCDHEGFLDAGLVVQPMTLVPDERVPVRLTPAQWKEVLHCFAQSCQKDSGYTTEEQVIADAIREAAQ